MNEQIERLGRLIEQQLPEHPEKAAGLLAAVYRLLSVKAGLFPGRAYVPSREMMQSEIARLLADFLRDPSRMVLADIFMPTELFTALGLRTVPPEALATYLVNTGCEHIFTEAAEAAGASPALCSYHRILTGLDVTGIMMDPLMIASTSMPCDANLLSFRRIAERRKLPYRLIDVPYRQDEDAVSYAADQLRLLFGETAEAAGKKPDPEKLKEAVARSKKQSMLMMRALDLRAACHLTETLTPELLLILANHTYMGTSEGLRFTEQYLEDLRKSPAKDSRKRLLWMHILPNWNDGLRALCEGSLSGAEILASDMSYDSILRMDPAKPFESMARRLVMNSYNGDGMRRIKRVLSLADQLQADGIVIFCQWGCKHTQGIALKAASVFRENGLPAIILDGDGCSREDGGGQQLLTRFAAFLEQPEGAR